MGSLRAIRAGCWWGCSYVKRILKAGGAVCRLAPSSIQARITEG